MTSHPAPLKLGVAGAGVMGRNHARVAADIRDFDLTPGLDMDALTEMVERAMVAAEMYGRFGRPEAEAV